MDTRKTNSDQVFLTYKSHLGGPKIVFDDEVNESRAEPMSGITGVSSRQRRISSSKSLTIVQEISQPVDDR